MNLRLYGPVLANRELRSTLALGFLIRVPTWAGAVLLTLHVVSSLRHSYGEAGLVSAASTVAVAISGPWRGRLLDRYGLRRTVAPSLAVQLVCWSVAPWVGYLPLLLLAALAGLFIVPTFSILRQVIVRAVPPEQRRTALSLDSAGTELSFMVGPALGVYLGTVLSTTWALLTVQLLAVAAGSALWFANPPLTGGSTQATLEQPGSARLVTASVLAVLVASAATTLVLTGTDVGVVAALRGFGDQAAIGWVLALWAFGSLVGGLTYGAWHRSVALYWLLGALSALTLPVVLVGDTAAFAVVITVAGVFCAPTVTASVEQLARLVPERSRGEAMGWHGSAMTTGSALGAPVAGFAIDRGGWQWGFAVVSLVGLVVACGGVALAAARNRPRRAG